MLILSRADLEGLLVPADVIDALESGFRLAAAGRCEVPARSTLAGANDGVLLLMPAAIRAGAGGAPALGTKLVSVYPGNRARGSPTLHASYVLMDAATGRPEALLEGAFLTGLRTGATSALAARHLARPDASRVVCFGAGAQAAFQLACLAAVRPLRRVAVVGRDPGRAAAFVAAMRRRLGIEVESVGDPRAAVQQADLVTCATTSPTPVVAGADLRPGAHVDLVGAFRPTEREADTEAVRRARVVVDTYAGALAAAGDILLPMQEGAIAGEHVVAELAQVVTGMRPGRTRESEITLFKSVGWALEDLVTARLAVERARARRVGVEVAL